MENRPPQPETPRRPPNSGRKTNGSGGSPTPPWLWLLVMGLQILTAALAFRLDRESLRPLWVLPLQQIVYRQLMYAVLIQSVASAVTGTRLGWQKIPRAGLFSAAPAQEAP